MLRCNNIENAFFLYNQFHKIRSPALKLRAFFFFFTIAYLFIPFSGLMMAILIKETPKFEYPVRKLIEISQKICIQDAPNKTKNTFLKT